MSKRNLILVIAIVAMVSIGAFGVFAQDDNGDSAAFPCPMHANGGQGFGQMQGFMFDEEHHNEVHTAIAGLLGIDEETLYNEMSAGKTLEQLAEEYGVDYQTIEDAFNALHVEHLAEMVQEGILTQEQADLMQEHMDEFGFGFMGNMMSGGFGGMMGGFGNTNGRGGMMGGRGGMMGGNTGGRGGMMGGWGNNNPNNP